ncbi:hypothetical protein B0H14DRAFT_3675395 [Mycena olivaceomarginata]|nr:hypothetical protein B0H14DRAFT_3675395 [Mycena olivaceomarginata]
MFISGTRRRGRRPRNSEVIQGGLIAFGSPMMGALFFHHPKTGPSNFGIAQATTTLARSSIFPQLPKDSTDSTSASRSGRETEYTKCVNSLLSLSPPFPDDTRMAMISGGQLLLWDIEHSTPYYRCGLELTDTTRFELSCTSSGKGDAVYIAAMCASMPTTSIRIWKSDGIELLDSNEHSSQWEHIRAKYYPNVGEGPGWVMHTKDPRIPPRQLAWIPPDRRNKYSGASATSQSGRLFAMGGHSGLITILDVSAMVEHLAADAERRTT